MDPGDVGYGGLGISVPSETLIGARNTRLTLEAGFTTVRNVRDDAFTDVALRDAVRDGDTAPACTRYRAVFLVCFVNHSGAKPQHSRRVTGRQRRTRL
jgi:hypothetical protein